MRIRGNIPLTGTGLLLLLTAGPGQAQLVRDWRIIASPHFELISRYDPAQTARLVMELEWARAFFETSLGWKSILDRRVLIFVPDSPFDYEQISPSKWSTGYFLPASWRDIIVLRDLVSGSRARQALLHEYTHLVLHHQGGRWPAWFNEGMAEFFETMRLSNGTAEAGLPLPGRIALLRREVWLPISYVVSLEVASQLPSAEAMHRFYAQCWLYIHMLRLAPAYRDRLAEFAKMLKEGRSTEEALRRVYGKSLVQFDDDARAWFRRGRFKGETFQAPPNPACNVAAKVIGELDVEIAKATVAVATSKKPSAKFSYARLAKMAGASCELQAPLGDLAFASGLFTEASAHYREAIQCGASASELAKGLELALSYRRDVRWEELESLKAITGRDRYHYLLGRERFFARDYEGALREFDKVSALEQRDEFRMRLMKALALAWLGRFDEAERLAEQLRIMARDDEEHQSARLTIDDVQRARRSVAERALEPKLLRLEGEVIHVDCMGERARLWVRAGSETKKLLILNPNEVSTGPSGATLEFRCGPQRRAVVVGYEQRNDPTTDTIGRIRHIEFRQP